MCFIVYSTFVIVPVPAVCVDYRILDFGFVKKK